MKKAAVSTLLKGLLDRVHRALFRHMVKSGLVLCVVQPGEEGHEQVETTTEAIDEQAGSETPQTESKGDETGDTDDDGHVVVTIGDVTAGADEEENRAPEWVRDLRKSDREKARKIRELEQKLEAATAPATKAAEEVGPEPDMEDADIDYDKDRFKARWNAWNARKQASEARLQAQVDQQKAEQGAWQAKLDAHGKAKAALKVPDYDDAESVVSEALSVTQRAIIVSGAENSAHVEYALGKNPAKLKELASITDPVKFAFAVAKLETQLKVTPRKAAPAPERVIRGNIPATATNDALETLRAEADRTGDRTKVTQYMQKQKQKQAQQ